MHADGLDPLPYHVALRDFLKREERPVWDWFASNQARREHADAVRFDLLKSTYRLEPEADPTVYEAARDAAQALALDVPITIYQSQGPAGANAGLAYIPGEAHIVLVGPVQATFTPAELRAVMGHELAHLALWERWDGDYLVADQVLAALTRDARAEEPHFASARLMRLYTEIYCDRSALAVVGDPLIVVSMLVKLLSGITDVNPTNYLRQAAEVLSKDGMKSAGTTHPEELIRAHAVQLFHDRAEDVEQLIAALIEGSLALESLDLLSQLRVSGLTRRLLDALLAPPWMRTDLLVGHARLFFPDYEAPRDSDDERLGDDLQTSDAALRNYYCYVLLDFVTADRELEELPLAAALVLAEKLGLKDAFVDLAKKELRMTKKQFEHLDRTKEVVLARAEELKSA